MTPSQTVSPRRAGAGHSMARSGRILSGQSLERPLAKIARRIFCNVRRVGDDPVPHEESLLGGLHESVEKGKALGLGACKSVEHTEDHEGRQSLGRRGRVVHGPTSQVNAERCGLDSLMGLEVCRRHRAADPRKLGGIGRAELAPIEILKSGGGESLQRRGKPRLDEERAGGRCRAMDQELLCVTGTSFSSATLAAVFLCWLTVTGTPFLADGSRRPESG